jgi:hypothetical protein
MNKIIFDPVEAGFIEALKCRKEEGYRHLVMAYNGFGYAIA